MYEDEDAMPVFELQENGRKIYQKGKTLNKILWLSHHYKSEVIAG